MTLTSSRMGPLSLTTSLSLTLALLSAASRARAQADTSKNFYIGTTQGVAAVKADKFDVDSDRRGDARPSAGLFAGARLGQLPIGAGLPVFAEAGYQQIARHKVGYKTAGGTTDLTTRGHSLYLAGKLDIPITSGFALYGKLGVARNTVDGSTPAGQTVIDIDGSRTSALVGFGAQYCFDNGLMLRGELASLGKTSKNSEGAAATFGVAYAF